MPRQAGWRRHRCDSDPLCERRICQGAEWPVLLPTASAAPRPTPLKGCLVERLAARSGLMVQMFSVGELLLFLRTSASRELTRHGYRRGYAGWLLTIDTALALDFISAHGPDALLLALDRWSGPRVSVASAGRLRLGPRLIPPDLA